MNTMISLGLVVGILLTVIGMIGSSIIYLFHKEDCDLLYYLNILCLLLVYVGSHLVTKY